MTNSFSRNSNLLILVGMAMQAAIAAGLGVMHAITLSPGQQVTTAALLVIVTFGLLILTKDLNKTFIGMAIQALVSGLLAQLGLIQLNPGQQAIAGVLYAILIVAILLLRKK